MTNLEASVIITGPTTTGKSEISTLLAREIDGAIINTDSYYLYAGDGLHIGLGLSQDEPPEDVPHYLFGVRDITEPKPTTEEFYGLIGAAAEDALAHAHLPIIQGCSFTLTKHIVDEAPHTIYVPIWRNQEGLVDRCYARVTQMLEEGLIDEAAKIIENGHENSWVVKKGIIYRPTIEYVKRGRHDIEELIGAISLGIIEKAQEQEEKYQSLPDVIWVPHDNNPQEAFEVILEKLA